MRPKTCMGPADVFDAQALWLPLPQPMPENRFPTLIQSTAVYFVAIPDILERTRRIPQNSLGGCIIS